MLGRWDAALLHEIDAYAFAAAHDVRRVHAEPAERVDGCLPYGVVGQLGHKRRLHAELRQANRHIGLAAAVGRAEFVRLYEPQIPFRRQPQHDLPERYNFHVYPLLFMFIDGRIACRQAA